MIKLHFEKLSRFNRDMEPCNVAIPFKKGELSDLSKIVITDDEKVFPSQSRVTSRWEDGTVKWLLVHFLADLPGNKGKDYYFTSDSNASAVSYEKMSITKDNDLLCIDTGAVKLYLNNLNKKDLFNKIESTFYSYDDNEIEGPVIKNNLGEEWKAVVGEKGWEIIEKGPVTTIIQTEGKHFNSNGSTWINYVIRLYAYAGKPWIKMDYQIINCEAGEEQEIKGIDIKFNNDANNADDVKTALGISNYDSKIVEGKGSEKLYHLIDAKQLVYEANEHFPETIYGTFWSDWCNEKRGVCATVFQAQQNFPKAIEVDNRGIKIKIIPEEAGGIKLLQGMAKTHSILLHFHDAQDDIKNLNIRSLQFQMPDRPLLDPKVYEKAEVFGDIFVKEKIKEVERALIYKVDARGKAYGMLNWGDAPDQGYTSQGRGNGEPVWTNNEYDFPHAAMLMYARSSERRMLDYMIVAAQHWMDVDVCHFSNDPLRYQAQIIHSARHVTGEVEASHEWVEGLFDYYHVTGERGAYDTAIGIGENILRLLKQPRYQKKGEINARETGWALRALVALYKETNDEKWLVPAEKIVEHFKVWKEEFGGWLAPYTDHTAIRVPFMISIAVGSLMRYYNVKPNEEIKNMIIEAVDDMVENCMLENGLFYYKELPSLRRLGNNTLVLEALKDAYKLTGDAKYLKAGIETFKSAITGGSGGGGGKKIVGDAVILGGQGPKGFAQSFYPIVSFYAAAVKEGITK